MTKLGEKIKSGLKLNNFRRKENTKFVSKRRRTKIKNFVSTPHLLFNSRKVIY